MYRGTKTSVCRVQEVEARIEGQIPPYLGYRQYTHVRRDKDIGMKDSGSRGTYPGSKTSVCRVRAVYKRIEGQILRSVGIGPYTHLSTGSRGTYRGTVTSVGRVRSIEARTEGQASELSDRRHFTHTGHRTPHPRRPALVCTLWDFLP